MCHVSHAPHTHIRHELYHVNTTHSSSKCHERDHLNIIHLKVKRDTKTLDSKQNVLYGVALISRIVKTVGLFCKRAL